MTHAGSAAARGAELRLPVRIGGSLGAAGLAAAFAGLGLSPAAPWIEPVGAKAVSLRFESDP